MVTSSDEGIQNQVNRGLAGRLKPQQPLAVLAHLVAIAALVYLLLGVVSTPALLGWAAVRVILAALRTVMTLRARRDERSCARIRQRLRPVMAALGLTWGLGSALFMTQAPPSYIPVFLAIVATLVAGGGFTLMGDAVAFRLYGIGMLAPAVAGTLAAGHGRMSLVAVVLLVSLAGFMLLMSRESHRALVGHLRAAALLESRERQERAERAYLGALIASAPLAVAVLEKDARVRHVNAQFENLFGYSAGEAVGRRLDELVIPEFERPDFSERRWEGEILRDEVVRLRRDGTLVDVRLSAGAVGNTPENGLVVLYEDIGDRKRAELAQQSRIERLREALARVKTLRGLLPICASCKKIRDEHGEWSQVEDYIREHSEAEFTHGLCPSCLSFYLGDSQVES